MSVCSEYPYCDHLACELEEGTNDRLKLQKQLAEARAEVERLKFAAPNKYGAHTLEGYCQELESEVKQLEAANRELVEALKLIDETDCTNQEKRWCCVFRNTASSALSTPHAKLAAAQAEVLRAAKEWFIHWKSMPLFNMCTAEANLYHGVKALEAAEKEVKG